MRHAMARRPLLSAGFLVVAASGVRFVLWPSAFAAPAARASAGQAAGSFAHRPPAASRHGSDASTQLLASSATPVLLSHGGRILLIIAGVYASQRLLLADTDRFMSDGSKRLAICLVFGLYLGLNPFNPQTAAFTIVASTTLGMLIQPVTAPSVAFVGLAAATLVGTLQVGPALSGFGAPLLWLGLLLPLCAKGFMDIRGSIHEKVGNVLDKVPVVGAGWANTIADLATAPLQCDRGDGLVKSMFATGSNASILAVCLAIGCLGVQGLGVQEWTRLALPLLLVLTVRPFWHRIWLATGITEEDSAPAAPKPKWTFSFDDFLRTCLFTWVLFYAGVTRTFQPVAAMLGVFSVMALRGMVSFKDISQESWDSLAIFASLVVLSGGVGSVYTRMGAFLGCFVTSLFPGLPEIRPWVLISAYFCCRRLFTKGEMHVAALFPTFLAALANCGMRPAQAAITLTLATNLGSKGQSSKQMLMRFIEITMFLLARQRPWLVVTFPVLGYAAVSLFENRGGISEAASEAVASKRNEARNKPQKKDQKEEREEKGSDIKSFLQEEEEGA